MFFSPELLSKRDNGFGLLWLAATLGSKSAFKKLPKRSVMTADISQLCRLIAIPAEPLALRLSSNLLVGAARVYRVKQEIFMSDVTICFNSLKRVEHELRSMTSEGQLQMAQPTVKSSAVTLRADPKAALTIEFDDMFTRWDEYLNLAGNIHLEDDSDDNHHPMGVKAKGKPVTSSELSPSSEFLRATACTLPHNHNFILANSFDASVGGGGTTKLSSSLIGGLGYDDTFDGLDIGEGIGDDLVRELGEGWGTSPIEENPAENLTHLQEQFGIQNLQSHISINSFQDFQIKSVEFPSPSPTSGPTHLHDPQMMEHAPYSPPVELVIQPKCEGRTQPESNEIVVRKAKRTRPRVDVRTELTDEELKATRLYYLNNQNVIRCELQIKGFEKKQDDFIHRLLWDAPSSVHAKELADFWVEHFKAHVEARSGLIMEPQHHLDDGIPRQKRRKLSTPSPKLPTGNVEDIPMSTADMDNWHAVQEIIAPTYDDDMVDFNYKINVNSREVGDYTPNTKYLRSSEEPGQARRTSRPPPNFGDNLGVDMLSDTFHSQRSAVFPWDMAGSSSSAPAREAGIQLPTADWMSVERADVRLRGSPTSRRGSSLPSLPNPGAGSPAVILPMMQSDDDFVFDVPGDNYALESRLSEVNRVALEKNSYNFLEYAKMQYRSLPSTQYLVFNDVIPNATSTARIAATALYHCLVLATKDLLHVNQEEPYGRIYIRVA